jgi:hypothetical protein
MDIASLVKVGIQSNVQPPRKQAKAHLIWAAAVAGAPDREAAANAIDFIEPGLGSAGLLLGTATSGSVTAGRSSPHSVNPQQDDERQKLDSNSDVAEMLAVSDFWAATQVAGDAWSTIRGVPRSSVSLVFTSGGQPHVRSLCLPAISFADYLADVRRVPQLVNGRDPSHDGRIQGCNTFPQYFLAFALGLHKTFNQHPNTCMLLDIVPAIVAVAVQRLKQRLMVPRPCAPIFGATAYKPIVQMPKFSAFPGGHAAVGYALARVLSEVTGAALSDLESLAATLADDRKAAGLHTELDTRYGREVGQAMGQWLLDAVGHPDAFGAWSAAFINATKEW